GTAGTSVMFNKGPVSPSPSAPSPPSTILGLSTDAPTPPAQRGVICVQSSIAALLPPQNAPIVMGTSLPPSVSVRPVLPHRLPEPPSPVGMLPQTPLYSHPWTWTWTTCPEAARRQYYKTSPPLAPPSSSRPPEPTRGSLAYQDLDQY